MLKKLSKLSVVLTVLMVIGLVFTLSVEADYVPISERGYSNPESLISCEELNSLLNEDDVVVVDNRGNAKYRLGYIPGAINIQKGDMKADAGMRLSKEDFENMFSEFGIDNGDTVVVYDDHGNLYSAWLWWMAKLYGHEDIRMLDGGIKRWNELGYDTKKVFGTSRDKTNYEAEEADSSILATMEMVQEAIENEDEVILDVRARSEYIGEELLSGASRKGRIPNSVWINWENAFNDSDHSFKTAEELKDIYQAEGVTADKTIYPYCQSAVRSSHTTFVLTQLLGYEDVANYDGSWIEWSGNEDLPIETGE